MYLIKGYLFFLFSSSFNMYTIRVSTFSPVYFPLSHYRLLLVLSCFISRGNNNFFPVETTSKQVIQVTKESFLCCTVFFVNGYSFAFGMLILLHCSWCLHEWKVELEHAKKSNNFLVYILYFVIILLAFCTTHSFNITLFRK